MHTATLPVGGRKGKSRAVPTVGGTTPVTADKSGTSFPFLPLDITWSPVRRLLSSAVAANPPSELILTPLTGKGFPLTAYLVQSHLLLVALDPFTNESAWLLNTAVRVLQTFEQADCSVAFLMTGADADESRQFLGPHAREFLTFPDANRAITRAFGLERVPALIHVGSDGKLVNAAEDWNPDAWQVVTDELARMMRWTGPVLPNPKDPGAFVGTAAR